MAERGQRQTYTNSKKLIKYTPKCRWHAHARQKHIKNIICNTPNTAAKIPKSAGGTASCTCWRYCGPSTLNISTQCAGTGIFPSTVTCWPFNSQYCSATLTFALGVNAPWCRTFTKTAFSCSSLAYRSNLLLTLITQNKAIASKPYIKKFLVVLHSLGTLISECLGQALQRCRVNVLQQHIL